VRHRPSENEPEGWCLAKIIHKRDEFYFVHYENYENIYDEIVIEQQIRPVNAQNGPTVDDLHRQVVEIPKDIIHWFKTPDWEEKFETIIQKTKAYNVSFRPKENNIVVVGEKKPVEKSAVLVAFIVEHQCELLQLDNENIKISKNLDSKRQKIKSEAIEEVFVPKDLLGLIIGKGGSNLQYVKQEYGVGVHIIESSSEESQEYTETEIPEGKALIRVYGKDPKWVKQAVKDIFLQKVNITIEADKVAYCKGFQNQIVNDMKEKSGCVKVFIHEAEQGSEEAIIETIGNEDSLERLRMLLDTHLSYFEDYRQKEDVNRDLNKQMNKLNQNYGGGYYPNDANKSQGPSQRRGKKQWNQ